MKPAHKKRMASLLPHNHSEHLLSMRKNSLRFCQETKRTLYKCSANAKYTIVWQIQSYHNICFQVK